jgi:DNA polymerase-3 subunit alpha
MVNLHNHTQYSPLDGLMTVQEMVDGAVQLGHPAVAVTDHAELAGVPEFISCCAGKIKPIVGCEFYFVSDIETKEKKEEKSHILLIVKNFEGYSNLLKLLSEANINGFYSKPRIDWKLLEKYSDNLICLTACLSGLLSRAILGKANESVEMALSRLLEIFGENLFLEIVAYDADEQKRVNFELLKISRKYNLPVVVSSDTHYFSKEDAVFHDLLLAIQTQKRLDDPKRFRFSGFDFWFKDKEDYIRAFSYLPGKEVEKAIYETEAVAHMIEDYSEKIFEPQRLSFPIPIDADFERWHRESGIKDKKVSYLLYLCQRGMTRVKTNDYLPYLERFKREFREIVSRGFQDYFLVVQDYVNWAKNSGVYVGPARGSAAGSLIAYLLGITDVDPLKYGLYFERFLSPGRMELPDIDIDFEHEKRELVKRYLMDKYGKENVAQIATYTKMDKRRTIRDVGKALGITNAGCNKLVEIITYNLPEDLSFREIFAEKEAYDIIFNEIKPILGGKTKFFIEAICKLEGSIRQYGRHAAGIVISDRPIYSVCPLRYISGHVTTAYDMDDLARFGFLKLDILGVKALSVIKSTMESAGIKKIDWEDEKVLGDQRVWEFLSSGECIGLFQLETPGLSNLTKRLKPRSIDELAIVIALHRPGPLRSGLAEKYVGIKTRGVPHIPPIEKMSEILSETHGIMIFQEQVLTVARQIAGYTPEEADNLRKIIGKKQVEKLEEEKEKFFIKMSERGYPEEKIRLLWEDLVEYGQYAFNKSHAVSYAIIAYQTAFLKFYFPVQYMMSLLNIETENQEIYLEECKRMGISILPPDVNKSDLYFKIESINPPALRFGLLNIKQIGEIASTEIIENRPYQSLEDFLHRNNLSTHKDYMIALIASGAFSSITNKERKEIVKEYFRLKGIEDDIPEIFSEGIDKCENFYLGTTTKNILKTIKIHGFKVVPDKKTWESIPYNYPCFVVGVVRGAKDSNKGGKFYLFTPWRGVIFVNSRFKPEGVEGKVIKAKLKKIGNTILAEDFEEIKE